MYKRGPNRVIAYSWRDCAGFLNPGDWMFLNSITRCVPCLVWIQVFILVLIVASIFSTICCVVLKIHTSVFNETYLFIKLNKNKENIYRWVWSVDLSLNENTCEFFLSENLATLPNRESSKLKPFVCNIYLIFILPTRRLCNHIDIVQSFNEKDKVHLYLRKHLNVQRIRGKDAGTRAVSTSNSEGAPVMVACDWWSSQFCLINDDPWMKSVREAAFA